MKKTAQTLAIALLMAMTHITANAQETATANSKEQQWRLAAINREWAAVTQENQAWECVKQSETLRNSGYIDNADQRKKIMASAALLQKAGDLESKAVRNFDAAARNWKRITQNHSTIAGNAGQVEATTHITANSENALDAAHRAAGRYELAAEIYRSLGPSGASQSAALSEKAASCREALANR